MMGDPALARPWNPTGEPWPTIWQQVVAVRLVEWPSTSYNRLPGQMGRSFTLTLACGHIHAGHQALYKPGLPRNRARTRADLRPSPRRVRCGTCERNQFNEAVRAAVAGTAWEGKVAPR